MLFCDCKYGAVATAVDLWQKLLFGKRRPHLILTGNHCLQGVGILIRALGQKLRGKDDALVAVLVGTAATVVIDDDLEGLTLLLQRPLVSVEMRDNRILSISVETGETIRPPCLSTRPTKAT